MLQKQSSVILANYTDNYDAATTTANKSMGFDPSVIQSCFYENGQKIFDFKV